jgi:hypothetical protein
VIQLETIVVDSYVPQAVAKLWTCYRSDAAIDTAMGRRVLDTGRLHVPQWTLLEANWACRGLCRWRRLHSSNVGIIGEIA